MVVKLTLVISDGTLADFQSDFSLSHTRTFPWMKMFFSRAQSRRIRLISKSETRLSDDGSPASPQSFSASVFSLFAAAPFSLSAMIHPAEQQPICMHWAKHMGKINLCAGLTDCILIGWLVACKRSLIGWACVTRATGCLLFCNIRETITKRKTELTQQENT